MSKSSQRFDRIAENFARSEVHRGSATMQRLQEFLERDTLRSFCDVACGAGHLGLSYADYERRLVFCDPAPNMLAQVRKLAAERNVSVETHECFAEHLPFGEGEFNAVGSRLAPHHFDDLQRAISEMSRVVKSDGHVAIIDLVGSDVPHANHLNHELEMLHDPTHRRSYTRNEWEAAFSEAGLDTVISDINNRESESGITVTRWCEIAGSPPGAAAKIRTRLGEAPKNILDELWIEYKDGDYMIPVKTILVVGKPKR